MKNNEKRPWDVFLENSKKVQLTFSEERMSICRSCENFDKKMGVCNLCGCLMAHKTKLLETGCPINKWSPISVSYKEEA
jgi:hypothetical protein